MIKNILNAEFKYEDDKMYRLDKRNNKWRCCNDNKSNITYIKIGINKKQYGLHRIIYKYFNEDFDLTDTSKNNQIDHININAIDNRIENLRVVNASQNQRNKNKSKNGISKYIGVFKSNKKWRAQIRIDGKSKYLGTFETEEDASQAYELEKKKIFE